MKTFRFASVTALLALAICAVGASSAAATGWVSFGNISPGGQDADTPNAVIDAQGNITVLWVDDSSDTAYAATRPAGGQFGAPQTLGSSAEAIDAGVSSTGEVVAIWSTASTLDYAIRPAGSSSFSAKQTVSSALPASAPQVVVDPQGRSFAFWKDTTLGTLDYAVRQPGNSFNSPISISGSGTSDAFSPAVSANGSAYVAWDNAGGDINGTPILSGGSQGATNAALSGGNPSASPSAGMDSSGNPSVAWADTVTGYLNVVRITGGTPGTVFNLTNSTDVAPALVNLTTTAAGSSHVLWTNNLDTSAGIAQARRITAGGTLGQFQTPLSATGADARIRDADGNADGSVLGIWEARGTGAVQAVAAADAQPFGAATQLGATSGSPIDADVDINPSANGAAVWQSGASPNSAVAAGYDNSNPTLSNVSIPSTGTQLKSSSFSATPFDVFFLNGPVSWNFGDGKTASGNSVTHTYAKPGSFTVTATATDTTGNSVSSKKTIKVASGPNALGSVTNKSLRMARNGKIALKVRCAKNAVATCRGTIFLKSAKKVNISRKKTLSVGQVTYSVKQGKTGTARVKAKRVARRYINRKRRLNTRVSITGRDGFGKTVTKRKNVKLRKG